MSNNKSDFNDAHEELETELTKKIWRLRNNSNYFSLKKIKNHKHTCLFKDIKVTLKGYTKFT